MMRDEKGRPKSLFKTLRLMHGHNIDSGLNDLTEAFANFMTRARYFSIGHIRRTWSHSAVEFMKYRRRLPALTAGGGGGDGDSDDDATDEDHPSHRSVYYPRTTSECGDDQSEEYLEDAPDYRPATTPKNAEYGVVPTGMSDPRRVYIANVPARVTLKQLASFFTKFGRVASCTIPVEKGTSTMPRRTRGYAFVTFRNTQEAELARKAPPQDLTLYDRVMVVTTAAAVGQLKKRHSIHASVLPKREGSLDDEDDVSISSVPSAFAGEYSDLESTSPSSPNYGATHINALSNKQLATVISYLPLGDRIRVERVSKRWQEAAFESWSQERYLSFRRTFAPFRTRPLTNAAFKEIMRRCGPYVQSLDVSGGPPLLNEQCLKIVADYCPNLKQIDFTGLKVRWQALKTFAEACGPRLDSITYRDAHFLTEKAFWWLFRFSPQIRRVDLGNARRLSGHCFRLLSFPLEDVRLDGCNRLEPDGVEQLCLKSPRVKRLSLDNCQRLTDESLALIARCMNDLEYFSLQGGPYPNLTTNGLKQVAKLQKLQTLRLNGNAQVNDDILAAVAEGCVNLRVFTLAQVGVDDRLTKDGLSALSICSKLREIDFSYLNACQDSVLIDLVTANLNLEVVRVRACTRLTDSSMKALAEKCWKTLRELDISGCVAISNRSLERFLDDQRAIGTCDRPLLTIAVGGTSCETPKLMRKIDNVNANARLTIDPTDFSKRDLLGSAGAAAGMKQFETVAAEAGDLDDDDELSDDEFESLTAQRSFVLGELEQDDDDLLDTAEDPFVAAVAAALPVAQAPPRVVQRAMNPVTGVHKKSSPTK